MKRETGEKKWETRTLYRHFFLFLMLLWPRETACYSKAYLCCRLHSYCCCLSFVHNHHLMAQTSLHFIHMYFGRCLACQRPAKARQKKTSCFFPILSVLELTLSSSLLPALPLFFRRSRPFLLYLEKPTPSPASVFNNHLLPSFFFLYRSSVKCLSPLFPNSPFSTFVSLEHSRPFPGCATLVADACSTSTSRQHTSRISCCALPTFFSRELRYGHLR